jgi:Leucine-rich repeat (LRR) protein
VSGGDIAITFFIIAFFFLHVFVISPIFALIFDSKHKLKGYFSGLIGTTAAMVTSFVVFSLVIASFTLEFEKNNPYYYSPYSDQDSTKYTKWASSRASHVFSDINPSKVRRVSLSRYDLRYLPDEILSIDSLEALWLTSFSDLDLSHTFANLKNPGLLTELRISNFDLETVPQEILLLENLESLWIPLSPRLDPNELIAILSQLTKLERLMINGNEWGVIPSEIVELEALEVLIAENNELSSIPVELSMLPKLRTVNLKRNPLDRSVYDILDSTKVRIIIDEFQR